MAEYVAAGGAATALAASVDGIEGDTVTAIERLVSSTGKEKVADLRSALQEEMTDKAGVFRTEDSLAAAQSTVAGLRERFPDVAIDDKGGNYNYDLTEALEMGFLLDLAEALVVAARARTESRGGHTRDDFTQRDDANWLKHSLVRRPDGGADDRLELDYKPVVLGKYEPKERKY